MEEGPVWQQQGGRRRLTGVEGRASSLPQSRLLVGGNRRLRANDKVLAACCTGLGGSQPLRCRGFCLKQGESATARSLLLAQGGSRRLGTRSQISAGAAATR